jgi:hypothetical protein
LLNDSGMFGALDQQRPLARTPTISDQEQDQALQEKLAILPEFTDTTLPLQLPKPLPKKSSTPAPTPRPLSKRNGADGLALTWAELRAEVTKLNASLKPKEKHKALGTKTIQEFEAILDARDRMRALLTIRDEHTAAAHRCTQGVQRTVNIRILTLLAKDSELMALFKESMGGTSRLQLESGSNVETVHAGDGMGANHAFWVALQAAFNDACNCGDFPFEYNPSERLDRTDNHESPATVIFTPPEIKNGLFKGLGLITAKVPELFPPDFFDVVRLKSCYDAGVKEYQEMKRRWHASGQHGGKPMWHFVSPVLTEDASQQHLYLKNDSKRWDSLAFHCLMENVQELFTAINKPIPGGVGGMGGGSTPTPYAPSYSAGARMAMSWCVCTCCCMILRLHR